MKNPAEILRLVEDSPRARAPEQRVALTETERRTVVALLAEGSGSAVLEHVTSRATALAGPDGPAVRRRSISKAIAIAEAQLGQLTLLLAEAVARRDVEAVSLLDRAATGANRRLCLLLQELRFEETRGLRSAVLVAAGANVTVAMAAR